MQTQIKYQNDPITSSVRLAQLYKAAGDTIIALEYYRQAAVYAKAFNEDDYFDLRANINFLQHNYDSALYYRKLQDSSTGNSDIGEIYLLTKNYVKALPYFFNNLIYSKHIHNINTVMILLDDIAKDYAYQKKFDTSLKYAAQLLTAANATHSRQFIKDGNWLIWKIYDQQNKTDSAYKYRLQFDNINDSIAVDELARNLAIEKMKFNDEQKQSQIDLLKKDNEINQQNIKSESLQKNMLIAGLFITFLIGLIMFRTFILKRKNEKLENEKAKTALQNKSTELEIQALRAQMNPHFIFNCLSSINSFILKNKTQEASAYLTKFSRLIRMVLNNSKKAYVSLEDELDTLRLYLDMEKLRFKDSFNYSFTYNDSIEKNNIFIPPLLLQPFAENAIWHGLMHKHEQGLLNFNFDTEQKWLICIITDNGIGRGQAEILKSKSAEKQKSMGLKITSERLSLLNKYSDEQTFFKVEDLVDEKGNASGTRVHLKIHYRELTEV